MLSPPTSEGEGVGCRYRGGDWVKDCTGHTHIGEGRESGEGSGGQHLGCDFVTIGYTLKMGINWDNEIVKEHTSIILYSKCIN